MVNNLVLIADQTKRLKFKRQALQKFVRNVLKKLRHKKTAVSVVFVSDSKIKQLNKKHLRHSYATDVLAFPLSLPPFPPEDGSAALLAERGKVRMGGKFLGEIIISPARARVQAKQFDASFYEELMRYVCHGILHLSGYSDKTARQKARMRRMENQLLKLLPKKRII